MLREVAVSRRHAGGRWNVLGMLDVRSSAKLPHNVGDWLEERQRHQREIYKQCPATQHNSTVMHQCPCSIHGGTRPHRRSQISASVDQVTVS